MLTSRKIKLIENGIEESIVDIKSDNQVYSHRSTRTLSYFKVHTMFFNSSHISARFTFT